MPRRRGAQPGNQNALELGRYSVPLCAARLAANRTALKEREQRADEWIKTVPQTDYDAIVDGLRALRQSKEAIVV